MADKSIENEIRRLETARCRALVAGNISEVESLVGDDLVHIHGNGKVDNKTSYIRMMALDVRFLRAERTQLDVRVYGDVAVATGPLQQSIQPTGSDQRINLHIMTTQVWRQAAGAWKLVSFQATNIA